MIKKIAITKVGKKSKDLFNLYIYHVTIIFNTLSLLMIPVRLCINSNLEISLIINIDDHGINIPIPNSFKIYMYPHHVIDFMGHNSIVNKHDIRLILLYVFIGISTYLDEVLKLYNILFHGKTKIGIVLAWVLYKNVVHADILSVIQDEICPALVHYEPQNKYIGEKKKLL